MDPVDKAIVLRTGDLAGSWPIHVRTRKTGRILTIDERPKFWLDQRGQDKPAWQPDRHKPDPKQTRLSPDLAHQGSFATIPYIVTGDFYYLEEAYFWGGFCLVATWPHPRKDAEGNPQNGEELVTKWVDTYTCSKDRGGLHLEGRIYKVRESESEQP